MSDNHGYRAYGSAWAAGNVGWNVGWQSRLECKAKRINGLAPEYGGEEIRRTARGRSKREAPPRPDRGAHPFWPGDRALHGTGSPLVFSKKHPLNRKF